MAALALVLVGAGLVHSMDETSTVFNTSSACPDSCICTWERGGLLSGAVCTAPVLENFAHVSHLRALELKGCDRARWGEMGELVNLTVSNCMNESFLSDLHNVTRLQQLSVTQSSLPANFPCNLLTELKRLSITATSLSSLVLFRACGADGPLPLAHLDLSDNQIVKLEWSDIENFPGLKELRLDQNSALVTMIPPLRPMNALTHLSLTGTSSLQGLCDSVINSLPSLEHLDLSESKITSLPPRLLLHENLTSVIFPSHAIDCSCQLTVLLQDTVNFIFDNLQCILPDGSNVAASTSSIMTSLSCSPPILSTNTTNLAIEPGHPVTLDCPLTGYPVPTVLWLSPRLELLRLRTDESGCSAEEEELILGKDLSAYSKWPGHLQILPNGSLVIDQFGWRDRGEYICYLDNFVGNVSSTFNLELEAGYRDVLYYWSILFGFVTAVVFLLVTLAGKLLHHLLWNYGCCSCCACCGGQALRTRKLATMVESIEAYRIQQLEKLRENYQNNSQRIRDNYSMQVEKMREHYSTSRGASQVASDSYNTVKDQYWDQVTKMREYSNSQLAKSHENYIFQRQRLRKFSAQNYLKIRETGKYTHKTLSRVLENMPAVSDLTSCRQGQVPDWDNKDMELHAIDETDGFEGVEGLGLGEGDSLYFTPSGTPLREGVESEGVKGRRTHKRMVSNLSNFLPFWWGMGQTDSVETQTVAIVESNPGVHEGQAEADRTLSLRPATERCNEVEIDEVLVVGGLDVVAPLAQEEDNLSLCDNDFATPEAVSPVNRNDQTSIPSFPMTKVAIEPVDDNINGIQRCESPGESQNDTEWNIC